MRILQVIPFLWSGAGNVVTRLCAALAANGDDVGIVTSGRSKGFTDWPEYREQLKASGVRHFQIDFFDREPAVFWRNVDAFSKVIRGWQPHIIHCHSGVPACAAAAVGGPYIAQLHSWGVGRPEWMNTMDLSGFRRAARVLCGSMAYHRILVDGGVDPSRVRYLPWGLDFRDIHARSRGLYARVKDPHFRVGFLGRIEPRKCQFELTLAFQRFCRRYPQSELEFIGPVADKEYADEICRFIAKTGLGTKVKIRGRLRNPYPALQTWNLFTSLSADEGQGLAILEAMALGVPVLGRRAAGVEDYLHDGNTGMMVPSASAAEVAERMEWAHGHEHDLAAFASRARRMVETNYNWNSTLEKMNRLYETVTGTHQRLD